MPYIQGQKYILKIKSMPKTVGEGHCRAYVKVKGYKAQVTESKFLVDNAYVTVDNNEIEDVVGIQMYSRQLDENVLGNILKHIHKA